MQAYSRMGAVGRAVAGTLVFVLAGAAARGVAGLVGAGGFGAQLLPAVVLCGVAVALVLLLRTRVDRRPVHGLGLRRPWSALLGLGVVAGSAAVVLGGAAAAGVLTVRGVDAGVLAGFLLTNTVLALLLEAVPEELVFRGYVYTALRDVTRPWVAALGTTALFVLGPMLGEVVDGLAGGRADWGGLGDPVAYAVLLAVFGTMLVTARIATGSVYACMAAHLMFLTVNRTLVVGDPARSGVHVLLAPGGELLVLVYLLLAAGGFALLGLRNRSGRGSPTAARPPAPLPR